MNEHVSFMVECECGRGKFNPKMTDKCAYCEFGLDEEPEYEDWTYDEASDLIVDRK